MNYLGPKDMELETADHTREPFSITPGLTEPLILRLLDKIKVGDEVEALVEGNPILNRMKVHTTDGEGRLSWAPIGAGEEEAKPTDLFLMLVEGVTVKVTPC